MASVNREPSTTLNGLDTFERLILLDHANSGRIHLLHFLPTLQLGLIFSVEILL